MAKPREFDAPVVDGKMSTDEMTITISKAEGETPAVEKTVSFDFFVAETIDDAVAAIGVEQVLAHVNRSLKSVYASIARANATSDPAAKANKAAAMLKASGLSPDELRALLGL